MIFEISKGDAIEKKHRRGNYLENDSTRETTLCFPMNKNQEFATGMIKAQFILNRHYWIEIHLSFYRPRHDNSTIVLETKPLLF